MHLLIGPWRRGVIDVWRRAALAVALVCCVLQAGHRQILADSPGWQAVPTGVGAPGARSQFGMAAGGRGLIYLYGGRDATGSPSGDFWVYNAGSAVWQELTNDVVPALVEPHLAVDNDGDVWEFGGVADPSAPHVAYDGHSYGLYEYVPVQGQWRDMTPEQAEPDVDWPAGREDHGFAYDAHAGTLLVFAGEGLGDAVLNDLWSYDVQAGTWSRVTQQYASPNGVAIAPREIYNISTDQNGHAYVFGGAYLAAPNGISGGGYANDLWRYDDSSQTWTLLAGTANGYDPAMPVPRHYYGQTCDANGNFLLLGGYVSDAATPPFFAADPYASYALVFQFAPPEVVTGAYGLADFWQYDQAAGVWRDRSSALGSLANAPMIPYNMVFDPVTDSLYTFGGFHADGTGGVAASSALWAFDLGSLDNAAPTATRTASPTAPPPTPTATARPTASAASPSAEPTRSRLPVATVVATAYPSATPTAVTWMRATVVVPRSRLLPAGQGIRSGHTPLPAAGHSSVALPVVVIPETSTNPPYPRGGTSTAAP